MESGRRSESSEPSCAVHRALIQMFIWHRQNQYYLQVWIAEYENFTRMDLSRTKLRQIEMQIARSLPLQPKEQAPATTQTNNAAPLLGSLHYSIHSAFE